MLHQVKVTPEDIRFLRFLWWTNGDLDADLKTFHFNVHLFGATSSPSCWNFALKKTAIDSLEKYPEDVSKTIMRNFYVDDCLKSVDEGEHAIHLVHLLKDALLERGFKLTKFTSNSKV